MSVEVKVWSRSGRSRLYIQSGSKSIGHLDLSSMTIVTTDPADRDICIDALHKFGHSIMVAAGEQNAYSQIDSLLDNLGDDLPAIADEKIRVVDPGWIDLSRNAPGSSIDKMDANSYRIGVAAEQRTAGMLASLGQEYRVIHSLPLTKKKDIDHLVVGPCGVVLINTKYNKYGIEASSKGVIMSDGYKQNWLTSVQSDANEASKALSAALRFNVGVSPLIVCWSDQKVESKHPSVVEGRGISDHFRTMYEELSPDTVDVIFSAARRSDTWTNWH